MTNRTNILRALKGSLLIAGETQPRIKGFSSIDDFLSSGEEN